MPYGDTDWLIVSLLRATFGPNPVRCCDEAGSEKQEEEGKWGELKLDSRAGIKTTADRSTLDITG